MGQKTGLLTFAEQREEVYAKRKVILEEETDKLLSALKGKLDVVPSNPIITKKDMISAVEDMRKQGVSSIIISLPIWASPHFPVLAVKLLGVPVVLYGNDRMDSSSKVAMLAAGGAFDQAGFSHKRIIGDIDDPSIVGELIDFCTAAQALNQLKGMTYGCFGGRGASICTTTADLAQWQALFGIDIEHIGQIEIVRIAESINEKDVQKYVEWVKTNFGKIEYEKNLFTPDKLELQVRSYLATKKIIKDRDLDFMGIKCQPEMSDHYVLQCLNQMLLNDPYDADGPKEPIVSSCEADHDGALSMQILKLLSGLKPTLLLDVRHFEVNEFIGANCGSMPSWYANYSNDPSENLKDVHLISHVFGKAGGGATQLVAGDKDVTLARLCRKNGKYWMAILKGSIIKKPREELKKSTWTFPHAFIKAKFDKKEFLSTYGSNHIHVGVGDLVNKLVEFCELLGVDYKIYSN